MLLIPSGTRKHEVIFIPGFDIQEQGVQHGWRQYILEYNVPIQSNSPDNFLKDIPINGIMRSGECVQSRNLTLGKMGAFYTPNHLEHKALF
jgi:hypothetical protein